MATILKNIVRFTGLAVGVPVAIAHRINVDDRATAPTLILPNSGPFTVAVDATNVTVTRTVLSPADAVDVYVELFHTYEAVYPRPLTTLPAGFPFILQPGGSGGAGAGEQSAINEQWEQQDVTAGQAAVALSAAVSSLFNEVTMVRGGSLTGLRTRLTAAIAADTATVTATINGAPVALAVVMGAASTGGGTTIAAGVVNFAAGDRVGCTITTDAGFLPSGSIDLSAWLEATY